MAGQWTGIFCAILVTTASASAPPVLAFESTMTEIVAGLPETSGFALSDDIDAWTLWRNAEIFGPARGGGVKTATLTARHSRDGQETLFSAGNITLRFAPGLMRQVARGQGALLGIAGPQGQYRAQAAVMTESNPKTSPSNSDVPGYRLGLSFQAMPIKTHDAELSFGLGAITGLSGPAAATGSLGTTTRVSLWDGQVVYTHEMARLWGDRFDQEMSVARRHALDMSLGFEGFDLTAEVSSLRADAGFADLSSLDLPGSAQDILSLSLDTGEIAADFEQITGVGETEQWSSRRFGLTFALDDMAGMTLALSAFEARNSDVFSGIWSERGAGVDFNVELAQGDVEFGVEASQLRYATYREDNADSLSFFASCDMAFHGVTFGILAETTQEHSTHGTANWRRDLTNLEAEARVESRNGVIWTAEASFEAETFRDHLAQDTEHSRILGLSIAADFREMAQKFGLMGVDYAGLRLDFDASLDNWGGYTDREFTANLSAGLRLVF